MQTIKPSQKNTNKHTQEGTALLKKSINDFGVLESIATATDGTIITGHARFEQFKENGLKPKFIKLEKNEFAVLETDIENNTKQYYEAQIMANTTANKNFDLDIEMIDVIAEEFDIDAEELGVEVEEVQNDVDYSDKNKEYNANDFENQNYTIKLEFSEDDYNFVKDKIKQLGQSPEKVFYDALVSL
jgi:ParB-like chromosome segregation protein Spo0J